MFDIPGLDMMSPMLAAASPVAGAFSMGESAGGAIADAASSAWDFGSNAIANIGGAFDPSMVGTGAPAPLPLGLMDDRGLDSQIGGEMVNYDDYICY